MLSKLIVGMPKKPLYAEWIWSTWLKKSSTLHSNSQSFVHEEFIEDEMQRPIIEDKLSTLLYDYHTSSPAEFDLLAKLRYKQLAAAFRSIRDQRPHQQSTQTGHLIEILACEYAKKNGYDIPVLRLRYNPNPDQSMKGDDILGFRFSNTKEDRDTIFVGEGKFRSQFESRVVREAYDDLLSKKAQLYPTSMEFVATILSLNGKTLDATRIRQLRQLNATQPDRVKQKYLLFLGTINKPQNPFQQLEEYGENILPDLRAVNVVFKSGLQDWITQVYEKEFAL